MNKKKEFGVWFVFLLLLFALFEFFAFLKQSKFSSVGFAVINLDNAAISAFPSTLVLTLLFLSLFVLIIELVKSITE